MNTQSFVSDEPREKRTVQEEVTNPISSSTESTRHRVSSHSAQKKAIPHPASALKSVTSLSRTREEKRNFIEHVDKATHFCQKTHVVYNRELRPVCTSRSRSRSSLRPRAGQPRATPHTFSSVAKRALARSRSSLFQPDATRLVTTSPFTWCTRRSDDELGGDLPAF